MSKIYKNKRGREVFKIQWNSKNQGTLRTIIPHGVGFNDGDIVRYKLLNNGDVKVMHVKFVCNDCGTLTNGKTITIKDLGECYKCNCPECHADEIVEAENGKGIYIFQGFTLKDEK